MARREPAALPERHHPPHFDKSRMSVLHVQPGNMTQGPRWKFAVRQSEAPASERRSSRDNLPFALRRFTKAKTP